MPAAQSPVESIFFGALPLSPQEREGYLDSACGQDADLRREVERLLRAHPRVGTFLQTDAPQQGPTVDLALAERPGALIGPYKLLEQIGTGGFGVVFMADQQRPVRRKVALKVLKPGMDTRQVVARFEAERQALALMDHPNIAHVFDGGQTASGRPYFVMELVKGISITEFCDQNHLTPRERLELFVPVCQAVQHAHQKGIIHRDLKPSNVLVTVHDTAPVVKVIDFGVAKALGQELTDNTLFTAFAQIVGTPVYMSPEQAGMSGLDIDTRSDVYSLGVLLYELLTGTTPFAKERFKEAGYDEIRRIIREEEPPKPSTRISTLGQAATTVSTNRHSDPGRLSRLLRGELDWIVMKALEKDRNRRYETASALAADVERYLNDEPVQACPPSAWYRFRKFARRNKRAAVMAGFLFALLLVAFAVLVVSYAQVQQALHDKSLALDREKYTTYLQRTDLAGREMDAGNVSRAEELLDGCEERLRGWEWHFLKRQRYGKAPPMQHPETVTRVAFSPDGRHIATVCMQGELAIRDVQTGLVLHALEPRSDVARTHRLVRAMGYSPDGRYLAVARHDGQIHVWDPNSGQLLHTLEGHKGASWHVAFSPDSHTLASGGADKTLRLWDLASGKALQVFDDHPAAVMAVAFRPDGRSVLAACDDGTVKVWDRGTAQPTFSFRGQGLAFPNRAWFSPDSRRLAWACWDGAIKIWDTTTGRLEIDQQTNMHQCRAVAFNPDGKRIALAGFDGTLRILDAITGKEMLTIFAHPSLVADAEFSRDGNKLASGSYDHTVRIWDATPLTSDPSAAHCVTLTAHKALLTGVTFSPDGRWLASGSRDGVVKVWEVSPGGYTLRYTLRGHSGPVGSVAFSTDKRTLASGSWDKSVKLWDLNAPVGDSLTELRTISCAQRVSGIAFSPDARRLAIGQFNGIAMHDPATGMEVAPFKPTPAPVPAVAFTPDSRHLISSGASDPAIKAWEEGQDKMLFEIRHFSSPNSSVAVSPDGRLLASPARDAAAAEPAVFVWEVDWDAKTYNDRPLHILKGHTRYVFKVAFSPDGRYLASGSWDATVKIWDVNTGQELQTLRGHAGSIYGLAFSPDGRRLATASGSASHGEVKVWDASLWQDIPSEER
jgi:WD40 repeat protein/serine/threonine protein kinase